MNSDYVSPNCLPGNSIEDHHECKCQACMCTCHSYGKVLHR